MNKDEMEQALKGLILDDTVPTWAKVLINCIMNVIVERGISEDLSKRVQILEEQMTTKDDILQLQAKVRILKIQIAGLKDELD